MERVFGTLSEVFSCLWIQPTASAWQEGLKVEVIEKKLRFLLTTVLTIFFKRLKETFREEVTSRRRGLS